MALSSAVISFDIADLLGNDFNPAKTRVSVTTNVPDGVIADTVGNQIRVGDGVVQIGADGTGTVSVWIPGTGSNPASWQTYIHLDATPSRSGVGRTPKTFGPFTITGDANLADLILEQEVPPTYLSTVTAQLQAYVDQASAITGVGTVGRLKVWAANPDNLLYGALTRDANGAVTSAPVIWPDGTVGTYTADTVSTTFPGAVDAYHITYGSPVTMTVTQPAVTRNTSGAVTARPALVVS